MEGEYLNLGHSSRVFDFHILLLHDSPTSMKKTKNASDTRYFISEMLKYGIIILTLHVFAYPYNDVFFSVTQFLFP